MNWVKENTFLTVVLAVTVLGLGFLGFKAFAASTALEDATAAYSSKASEYNNLRRRAPFPSQANLAKFEAQKAEAAAHITAFHEDLAKRELPVKKDIQPTQFQDELKKSVNAARTAAEAAGTKLPEKFYLGFERYETQPPDAAVTPALERQLRVIEWVVQQFINARVAEIRDLKRPDLAEERARTGSGASARRDDRSSGSRPDRSGPGQRGGPGGGGPSRADLVSSNSFDIVVFCRPPQFATVLSTIISSKAPQFIIPRGVRVKNEKDKGPPRVVEAPPPPAVPDPAATATPPGTLPGAPAAPVDPAAAPAPPVAADVNYIVGQEQIEASLRLEIVDFADAPQAKADAKPEGRKAR